MSYESYMYMVFPKAVYHKIPILEKAVSVKAQEPTYFCLYFSNHRAVLMTESASTFVLRSE